MTNVIAAQSLGRSALLDHESKGGILVIDDLFVIEQLEEAIVGDVFDVLVGAAPEKNSQRYQSKRDSDQDNTPPVETRFVPARFVVALRISIGLRHGSKNALRAKAGYHEGFFNAKSRRRALGDNDS